MNFQSAYSEKVKNPKVNSEPSVTKQSYAEALNIDNIIRRLGQAPIQAAQDFEAIYGEFDSTDLHDCMDKVNNANRLFAEVPSNIRGQFENNPGLYIDFVTNPDNLEKVREMGLAEALKPETRTVEETLDIIAQNTANTQNEPSTPAS